MPNALLTIAYDGTPFHGWAVQNDVPTVEGALIDALNTFLFRDPTWPDTSVFQGASRTDAGVHAIGQCANLKADELPSINEIERALNRLTPKTIQIVSAQWVDEAFNARHDSIGKHYQYRIWNDKYPHPLLLSRTWHVRHRLDIEAMQDAAQHLIGVHDFSSFRASGCQATTTVRELTSIDILKMGKDIRIDVQGTAFLKYMVRIMVGTLVEVGRGKLSPDDMLAVLEAKDRSAAGPTAEPQGLMLISVNYPTHDKPSHSCSSGGECKSTGKCKNRKNGKCTHHHHDHDEDHEDDDHNHEHHDDDNHEDDTHNHDDDADAEV